MPQDRKEYRKKYYQEHREKAIADAVEWNRTNDERRKAAQKRHYNKKMATNPEYFREKAKRRYHKNPEHHRKQAKKYRAKLRAELIEAYGGKCNCCGEAESTFLSIEHKQRDGKAHREEVGGDPTSIYRDLKKRGWPKDNYELLCFNCNRASWELGECPHRKKEKQTT